MTRVAFVGNSYTFFNDLPLSRLSLLSAIVATAFGLLLSARPRGSGICAFDYSRLQCRPNAQCELIREGWLNASCVQVPPKMPQNHPPVPKGATFCGLALDDDGYVVFREVRQWGYVEWGLLIGLFNWGIVGLLHTWPWNEDAAVLEETPLVVCVIAYSGSGKTFTGDYLAAHHDFAHVDGDEMLLNQHVAENKRLSDGLVQALFEHWLPGRDAPAALWQPYLQSLCDRVLVATKAKPRVVLTFSLYRREARDFVRAALRGRATVLMLKLNCDDDLLVERNMTRQQQYLELQGKTMEQAWDEGGCAEKWGVYGIESYRRKLLDTTLRGWAPFEPGEAGETSLEVDVSTGGTASLVTICAALGLALPSTNVDLSQITGTNAARWAASKAAAVASSSEWQAPGDEKLS